MSLSRVITRLDLQKDFPSFAELLRLCFGQTANISHSMYSWFLEGNPNNRNGHLMFVLKEGDRIIAADGLFPVQLYMRGKIIPAAYSVKSMTHPDYQRQGIFRMMTENSLEKGREAGIELVLGLANEASYRAYQKFGWPTLFEKEAYVKPVNLGNLLYNKVPLRLLAKAGSYCYSRCLQVHLRKMQKYIDHGAAVEIRDRLPEAVQDCWENYKASYHILSARDFKYLNYRYNLRPDANYRTLLLLRKHEVAGFAVIRPGVINKLNIVSVLELFTDPFNKMLIGTLVYHLIKYALERSIDYIVISTGLFGRYKETLRDFGFMAAPKKVRNNMMIAKPLNPAFRAEEISGYERWHLTQGDGETDLDY